MDGLTLQQLLCFDAVVGEGSFQAAAAKLEDLLNALHASRTRAVSLGIQIAIARAFRSASFDPTAAPRTLTVACDAPRESRTTPFAPTPAASFRTDFSRSPLPL